MFLRKRRMVLRLRLREPESVYHYSEEKSSSFLNLASRLLFQSKTLLSISKRYTLSNTLKNIEFAMKNFWTWLEQRNSRAAAIGEDACPVDFLSSTDLS